MNLVWFLIDIEKINQCIVNVLSLENTLNIG